MRDGRLGQVGVAGGVSGEDLQRVADDLALVRTERDVPGVVVSRVNMSTRFMRELLDAMQDSWSKWSSREGIRNLPETTEGDSE